MRVFCPKCGRVLDVEEINVATDVAQCRVCKEVFTLSELVRADDEGRAVDLNHPPAGTWYEPSFDGFAVGGTTRSPVAFFLIPFMAVWSGFSMGGIYGTQINGNYNRPGMVITLQMPRRLRFGSGLRDFRREFVADVLRNAMKSRGKPLQRPMARR